MEMEKTAIMYQQRARVARGRARICVFMRAKVSECLSKETLFGVCLYVENVKIAPVCS